MDSTKSKNIENSAKSMKDAPLVFVRCMTFNHEAYIEDALNGFVMQQTNFPFVVAIVDDASTDDNVKVIERFIKEHCECEADYIKEEIYGRVIKTTVKNNPNCILCAVLLYENHYRKKAKRPYYAQYEDAAKYIAMCEGDDYWTDPLKLQKQVDFLEANPEYSMCFHGAEVKNETNIDRYIQCLDINNRDYSATEVFAQWVVPTASIVYRRLMVKSYPIKHSEWILYGDIFLVEKCCHVGKIFGMADKMSVYRMQGNSLVHNPKYAQEKLLKMPEHFRCIQINFNLIDNDVLSWCLAQAYYSRFRNGKTRVVCKILDLLKSIYYRPTLVFSKVKQLICKKNE